ncbi:hypothetical protein UC317_1850 [Lactococcus lactis subsp. lactis]|uniref:DarT ssDNA thymidine ADP-ribosyltransferase family protein n=1 Tax=Lactococcus lactis TaxID=1358 RepID=UPI00071D0AFF|nr:DarT ssDNA thymidine ADP-ribosyltransferase family protein [Lactococcus lactis]ARE09955.1 DarT ssDNA thymidine ADP-ribosyltransferase family protein [Lactococcus lactis subsp. lactis]KSU32187.1 hypothetical protein UC317_1850 [Lactococcus lactis subsp. lactis]URL09006.1 DUF4433 domain-containing protein [Lactococcus lactis subsp. lactis]
MGYKNKKLLYHLTRAENLDNIFKYGLLSRNEVESLGFIDVANPNIIMKRNVQNLNSYIPFHFQPSSAFDADVKYKFRGENFVYITIKRSYAEQMGFKIIPSHPLNPDCDIYDYSEGFQKIDWEAMDTKKEEFPDDETKEYGKQVKMAECLSETQIPVEAFWKIYCPKEDLVHYKERYNEYQHLFLEGCWFD